MATCLNQPRVYLESSALCCAAGASVPALWDSLLQGVRPLSDLDFPLPESWPWTKAFPLEEPSAQELGVDRKQLRTMDKQARFALLVAQGAVRASRACDSAHPSRIGLFMGLPMVDEPVPPWSLLESLHESGSHDLTNEICFRETPPFSGLSQLNSSACGHISNTLGISGPIAAFSPRGDAGLQALMEGVSSVQEAEADVALVGAVAPTLNPLRILAYERDGWDTRNVLRPAEGAAFLVLSGQADPGVYVSGTARGFLHENHPEECQAILEQACRRAGIHPAEIGWCLPSSTCGAELASFKAMGIPEDRIFSDGAWGFGELGPADPLVLVLLAAHGLKLECRLSGTPGAWQASPLPATHALVTAHGPEGQYAAALLSLDQP